MCGRGCSVLFQEGQRHTRMRGVWGDLEEPGSGRICTVVPWMGPHPTHTYSLVAAKESRAGSRAGFSV